MPMTLIRRPRSPNVLHDEIRNEVRQAYKDLGKYMIERLLKDIEDWQGKPNFKVHVEVGKKRWMVSVNYDSKSRIGMIYKWVDEGTAENAGKGDPYPIVPVNADALHFYVPNYPKSLPNIVGTGVPGIVLSNPQDTVQEEIYSKGVMHPGIRPRNFTKSLAEEMSQRTRPKAFRSVTEAAIKRAKRKIGVQI